MYNIYIYVYTHIHTISPVFHHFLLVKYTLIRLKYYNNYYCYQFCTINSTGTTRFPILLTISVWYYSYTSKCKYDHQKCNCTTIAHTCKY